MVAEPSTILRLKNRVTSALGGARFRMDLPSGRSGSLRDRYRMSPLVAAAKLARASASQFASRSQSRLRPPQPQFRQPSPTSHIVEDRGGSAPIAIARQPDRLAPMRCANANRTLVRQRTPVRETAATTSSRTQTAAPPGPQSKPAPLQRVSHLKSERPVPAAGDRRGAGDQAVGRPTWRRAIIAAILAGSETSIAGSLIAAPYAGRRAVSPLADIPSDARRFGESHPRRARRIDAARRSGNRKRSAWPR